VIVDDESPKEAPSNSSVSDARAISSFSAALRRRGPISGARSSQSGRVGSPRFSPEKAMTEARTRVEFFQQGLQQLGWTDGRNVAIWPPQTCDQTAPIGSVATAKTIEMADVAC